MKIGRMILLAVAIEALSIVVLVVLVAIFGPADSAAAQEYAQRLGYWVGPLAGFVLCIGGGWLVARNLTTGHVPRGLLLGAMVAAIDITILIASGSGFQVVFLVSNLGRLVGGSLGGWLALKTTRSA